MGEAGRKRVYEGRIGREEERPPNQTCPTALKYRDATDLACNFWSTNRTFQCFQSKCKRHPVNVAVSQLWCTDMVVFYVSWFWAGSEQTRHRYRLRTLDSTTTCGHLPSLHIAPNYAVRWQMVWTTCQRWFDDYTAMPDSESNLQPFERKSDALLIVPVYITTKTSTQGKSGLDLDSRFGLRIRMTAET